MIAFRRVAQWHGAADCRTCTCRGSDLFADLQPADFSRMRLPIDRMTIEAGHSLYDEGEEGRAIYSLRSGLLKLVRYAPHGENRIVRLARAGDITGLELLVGHAYEHSAIALESTHVCRIPTEILHSLITETPLLNVQLMRRWQQSITQAEDWLTLLSTGRAPARVARLLLLLCADRAQPVCRVLSREDIASILGITTETASRVMADFRRRHIISPLPDHRLMIVRKALQEIAKN